MPAFTWSSFSLRLLFSVLLVLATFNPSGYSYFHWLKNLLPSLNPYMALSGLLLIIGWAIYIRATLRSLGVVGLLLISLFLACFVWMFIDLGWFSLENVTVLTWLAELIIAVILAVGMSWSHVRRRLSGQVDTDDVDQQ